MDEDDGDPSGRDGADRAGAGGTGRGGGHGRGDRPGSDDVADRRRDAEIEHLRDELRELEAELDEKTVRKDELEGDLRRYVRRRIRRGHARGWGPYLVLLYGTAMTLGAFFYLRGVWAVLAMIVVWLSTLGLYTLMVLVGLGANALSVPGRLRDAIGSWRS